MHRTEPATPIPSHGGPSRAALVLPGKRYRDSLYTAQYATAADVAAANLFNLRPSQTQNLTTTRTYEGGVKQLFWERKAEWSFAAYHIERNNLPSQQSATVVNNVGQQISDGVEVAAAVRPNTRWNIWGNLSYMRAYLRRLRYRPTGL